MNRKDEDRQFQIECLSKDLIEMLMEDFHLTMEEAMDVLYNSQTYAKVENKRTGLFYQSAVYVMDMLQEELENLRQFKKKETK